MGGNPGKKPIRWVISDTQGRGPVGADLCPCLFVSSVRSSSVYHGLLHIRKQATFSDFSNSSDSKVKVKVKGPNMCYIFEKHGIQGYRI